jgi:hypothetical protein
MIALGEKLWDGTEREEPIKKSEGQSLHKSLIACRETSGRFFALQM